MARQYTQMSNGGNIHGTAPRNSAAASRPAVPPPVPVNNAPPPSEKAAEKPPETEKAPPSQMLSLPFGNIDTERLMLILLIALLSSEGADFVLIAALVYVMM